MRKTDALLCVALSSLLFRHCAAQNGICTVTSSQILTQSYYAQVSYTSYYDCSQFGWGWSYCSRIAYTTSLLYSLSTAYVTEFACCPGYQQVDATQNCIDVNECASNGGQGPCQQNCTNTIGSFNCSCWNGFTLSDTNNTCQDVNECALNGGLGPCQQICINIAGSFTCSCNSGYSLTVDNKTCQDVNECALNGGLGPCQQNCTNTVGSFTCSCNSGYSLTVDNKTCQDINECALNGGLGPCQQNCTNTVGSFICSCQHDYIISSDGKSCLVLVTPTSATKGHGETIIPTPTVSASDIMMSPNTTQESLNMVYIQVRLLNVANCTSFMFPVALQWLYQSINNDVNEYCKCSFTMSSTKVICYDITRVTLRGTVEEGQLVYLKDWVRSLATTLNLEGSVLEVDKDCTVQVQSLDDPECSTGSIGTLQSVVNDMIGLSAGAAIGGAALVTIIAVVVVIGVLLIKFKKSKATTVFINPLYKPKSPDRVYENCDDNNAIYDICDDNNAIYDIAVTSPQSNLQSTYVNVVQNNN